MKIVSLQPTSTEMLFALGMGKHVVGRSHECTYPSAAKALPVVSTSIIDPEKTSSEEIDRIVKSGQPLYRIDRALLESLKPDLIFTQSLCDV